MLTNNIINVVSVLLKAASPYDTSKLFPKTPRQNNYTTNSR